MLFGALTQRWTQPDGSSRRPTSSRTSSPARCGASTSASSSADRGLRPRRPRGRRRALGVPAARRRLGVVERRPGHRRRRVAARRHAVRPRAHRSGCSTTCGPCRPPPRAIGTLVNTHANGDHCYGNQLVAGAEIVASAASAREMDEVPPVDARGAARAPADGLGEAGAYLQQIFGRFTFDGIEAAPPTTTFDGALDLQVGDRAVRLLELGPAHTAGDVVGAPARRRVLFTGDLVFHGGHPDRVGGPGAAMDRRVRPDARPRRRTSSSPGTARSATGRASRTSGATSSGWWPRARPRLEGGLSPLDAARDLAGGPYAGWGESERLVVNLTALARDLGLAPADDVLTLFGGMAALAGQCDRPRRRADLRRGRGRGHGTRRAVRDRDHRGRRRARQGVQARPAEPARALRHGPRPRATTPSSSTRTSAGASPR